MTAIFNQPQFQDADKAREYLEQLRWANGVVCPHCGVIDGHYKLEGKSTRPGVYKCGSCSSQFTVTVGTVFERSKIALNVWLQAVHLMCASKKGVSAKQLERMLGVTYKTAWFMAHRIREAMTPAYFGGKMGEDGGPVEADETYIGSARTQKGMKNKAKVVSLVERNGEKRTFHVADVTAATLRPILKSQIASKAHLMTDESVMYTVVGREFVGGHSTVKHSDKEYARKEDGKTITSNTVEASFAILKRGIYGTFHHVSKEHLQRYCNEFDFRWNTRASQGVNDSMRTDLALKGISGKRLTYRRIGQDAAPIL